MNMVNLLFIKHINLLNKSTGLCIFYRLTNPKGQFNIIIGGNETFCILHEKLG